MDFKRGNSGRYFVRNSSPSGGKLRASPPLSNNVRVCTPKLRQVNLVNAEVIPQDLTSPQQATLTNDKKTSDTTCMAEKPEQEKCPAQPPHNVIIQLDP